MNREIPPPPRLTYPTRVNLMECRETTLEFGEVSFSVQACNDQMRIRRSNGRTVTLHKRDQQVPYKAVILGSVVLAEDGDPGVDYARFFTVDWSDELRPPELVFGEPPTLIGRRYDEGGRIELGVENVAGYHIEYDDGVAADFDRAGERGFDFAFSTGFYGSFVEQTDGAYTLTFKGDRLDPEEEELRSQSKFIVSRSKYSGNLLLILQDAARVTLKA